MNAMRMTSGRQVAVAVVGEGSVGSVMIRVAMGLLVLAVALGVLLAPTPAAAVDTAASSVAANTVHVLTPGHGKIDIKQTECYLVPEGETKVADLYMWAQCIEIEGTLDGDIVAGFQEGKITGTVTQDLNGMCETMRITGIVGDDVRFACDTFYLDGYIGGDLIIAAKSIQISETAVIAGDAIIAGGTVTMDGAIGGRARIMTGYVNMDGTIAGNAEITTDGGIRLGTDAHIGGDLFYEGPSEIDIPEGAVAGEVTFQKVIKEEIDFDFDFFGGAGILLHFLGFIAALVAGTIIVALTKDHATRTAEIIRTKPLKSLGIGFVTYICMPIVLLLLLVFILTIPLMFVVGLAYAIALYIAKFYFSIWLGNVILSRGGRTDVSPIPSMLLGLTIVYLVTAIPIVGALIGIVIIFFGLGALMQRKETRLDAAFESAPVVSNGLPDEFAGTGTGE